MLCTALLWVEFFSTDLKKKEKSKSRIIEKKSQGKVDVTLVGWGPEEMDRQMGNVGVHRTLRERLPCTS